MANNPVAIGVRARQCACGTSRTQPPRSDLAARIQENLAAVDVQREHVSLHVVSQLLADLSTVRLAGLHPSCGWPRTGRRSNMRLTD